MVEGEGEEGEGRKHCSEGREGKGEASVSGSEEGNFHGVYEEGKGREGRLG